ncbi:MAG: 2Fe-2S iron-sulfur cluster-binding protein [Halobacteriales archaeon]
MVDLLGVALGLFLTLIVVAAHFARGTSWRVPEDISQEVLERRAASVPETDFPEPMNRSIGGGGAVGAIAPGESEGELEEAEEADEGGPGAIPEDEIEHFEIEFTKEGETIEVANNETLLDAGEDDGFDLPYACREGQCLSCSAHIPDGPSEDFVVHDNQEMLSDDELDEGYTLTCVAYPRADFTLETRESP